MTQLDVHTKIRERLMHRIERIEQKLAALYEAPALDAELAVLDDEITEMRSQMEAVSEQHRERLESRLERLLVKRERLELRRELVDEKRERLQEALEELRINYERHMGEVGRANVHRVSRRINAGDSVRFNNLDEERRKILGMLQDGKITVDDATRLLNALSEQQEKSRVRRKPRWVRIRVTDTDTGRARVNVTLPIGLVRAGLRAGGSIAGIEGLDTTDLEDLLYRGEVGHFVDIHDKVDGERVEIFVE